MPMNREIALQHARQRARFRKALGNVVRHGELARTVRRTDGRRAPAVPKTKMNIWKRARIDASLGADSVPKAG
jgi:hypothetical protein